LGICERPVDLAASGLNFAVIKNYNLKYLLKIFEGRKWLERAPYEVCNRMLQVPNLIKNDKYINFRMYGTKFKVSA